jgi:hypothetical protein
MKFRTGTVMLAAVAAVVAAAPLLARADSYYLSDHRLAVIDDPVRVRFTGGAERSADKIRAALEEGAATAGWQVVGPRADGRMNLFYGGRERYDIRIEASYDESGYRLRYLHSESLHYREEPAERGFLRVIHHRYNEWVRKLVTAVSRRAGLPSTTAYGFAGLNDVEALPAVQGDGRDAYRKYLDAPVPRAFAIGQDGAFGWSAVRPDTRTGRYRPNEDPIAYAVAACTKRAQGACRLYSLDERVVWDPSRP